jgi:heme a synthase
MLPASPRSLRPVPALRISPTTYRRVTLFALVALCVIIVTGGAVRLTGSGLGCPDWPNCDSTTSVDALGYHAWVEFGNRLFTGLVSVAVILAVLGSLVRRPRRRDLTWLSLGLVAGVIAQILIGALVVRTDLIPAAVSAHFLVSIALVWDAVVLHDRASHPPGSPVAATEPTVRMLAGAVVIMTMVVLFIGTLVTGAGPHSGDPGEVERLSLSIREVARTHGTAVVILLLLTIVTLIAIVKTRAPRRVLVRAEWLFAALVAQAAIGYTQYFTGVPVLLVGAHILGAVLVWVAVLELYLGVFDREETTVELPTDTEPSLVAP